MRSPENAILHKLNWPAVLMQRFTGKMKYLKKNLFIFGYLGFMVNKNLTKEYPEIYSTLMFYSYGTCKYNDD